MKTRFSNFYFTEADILLEVETLNELELSDVGSAAKTTGKVLTRGLFNIFRKTKRTGILANWMTVIRPIKFSFYQTLLNKFVNAYTSKEKMGKNKIMINDLKMGDLDDIRKKEIKNKLGNFETQDSDAVKTYHIPVYQTSNGGKFVLFNLPKEGAVDSVPENMNGRMFGLAMDKKANKVFEDIFGMTFKDWLLLKSVDGDNETGATETGTVMKSGDKSVIDISKEKFNQLVPKLKSESVIYEAATNLLKLYNGSFQGNGEGWYRFTSPKAMSKLDVRTWKDLQKNILGKITKSGDFVVVDNQGNVLDKATQDLKNNIKTNPDEKFSWIKDEPVDAPIEGQPSVKKPDNKPVNQPVKNPDMENIQGKDIISGGDAINKSFKNDIDSVRQVGTSNTIDYGWEYRLKGGATITIWKSKDNKYRLAYDKDGETALKKAKII